MATIHICSLAALIGFVFVLVWTAALLAAAEPNPNEAGHSVRIDISLAHDRRDHLTPLAAYFSPDGTLENSPAFQCWEKI
jgi:hypothetical protein